MEPLEETGARQAAEKVASFLNTRITKTGITYHVLFFNPRHLFFDDAGRIAPYSEALRFRRTTMMTSTINARMPAMTRMSVTLIANANNGVVMDYSP